ncbi:MAG: PEP-CTERM sorting domain-containing protein [Bryobacteraceae bacterium]
MKGLLLMFGGIVLAAVPGTAGVIFQLGNIPQSDEENVLFNTTQSASMVTGITNQTSTVVNFSSTADVLMTTANGQASITAQDGLINDVTISLANGGSFSDLILNPFSGGTAAGPATISVVTNDGSSSFSFSYPGGLGAGQNFVTITTTGGEMIESATITSSDGFSTLDQVRISGLSGSIGEAPEPGTFLLMAGALLGLVGIIGRNRRISHKEG